jgi:hypothetical protein
MEIYGADFLTPLFVICRSKHHHYHHQGSRKDFTDEETNSQEVDLVLSTTELWQLLEMRAEAEALRY